MAFVRRWTRTRTFDLLWSSPAVLTHGSQLYLHVIATSSWGGTTYATSTASLLYDGTPPTLSLSSFDSAEAGSVAGQDGCPQVRILELTDFACQVEWTLPVDPGECGPV